MDAIESALAATCGRVEVAVAAGRRRRWRQAPRAVAARLANRFDTVTILTHCDPVVPASVTPRHTRLPASPQAAYHATPTHGENKSGKHSVSIWLIEHVPLTCLLRIYHYHRRRTASSFSRLARTQHLRATFCL